MIQVTVAMPARNAAPFIAQAISGVREQTDVAWELIVVNDASQDQTADIVRQFDDPRIRLLSNATRRGISFCHNQILAHSTAPYIAHLDADDFILPGALGKMLTALENNPRAGLAHCQFYDIDAHGHVLDNVLNQRTRAYAKRAQGFDYRRELIVLGTVTSGLRTFPRRVLEHVGPYNQTLEIGEDLEMALRIVEHYEIAFVPEYLYVRRLHRGNISEHQRLRAWRLHRMRSSIYFALQRSGQVTYFNTEPYKLERLLHESFLINSGFRHGQALLYNSLRRASRSVSGMVHHDKTAAASDRSRAKK